MLKVKVFLLKAEKAVSKAGREYVRQPLEIIQTPVAFNARTLHFPASVEAALEPGFYLATPIFEDSREGLRVRFDGFEPVKA